MTAGSAANPPNILIVSAVYPATVGGFTIRELAVFDTDNQVIAIYNCAATKKDVTEIWEELKNRGRVTINTKDAPYEKKEIRLIVNEMPY